MRLQELFGDGSLTDNTFRIRLDHYVRSTEANFFMRETEIIKAKPIIFIDMDGVLADLFNHVAEIHDVEHYNSLTKEEWDKFLQDTDAEHLFANLPMFPKANKLLAMVVKLFGGYKILSSPLNFDREGSIRGKRKWLDKNITVPDDGRVFDHEKYKYAVQEDGTSNVLIDDWRHNIDLWNKAGGIGIKYQADEDSLDDLYNKLKAI